MSFVLSTDTADDPEATTESSDDPDEPHIDDAQRDAISESTVTLAWLLEGDDPDADSQLPLSLGVEANSQRIAEMPSDDDLEEIERVVETNSQVIKTSLSQSDLQGIEQTMRELSNTVASLQEENRELRESINWFEDWADQIIDQLDEISVDTQLLLAVSDLAVEGICPSCNAAPLQVKHPLLGTNRVECVNEDCKHVVAELEWPY